MMTSSLTKRLATLALLVPCALWLTGCGSCKPGRPGPIGTYDIEVTLDPSLQQGAVVVDLVGVNVGSLPDWENYPMSQYWQDGNQRRRDADKHTLNFAMKKSAKELLPATDDKWKQWQTKNVTHVLVLADLPGSFNDAPGNADARRKVLPLDRCHWTAGTKKLALHVKPTLIEIQSPTRQTK